MSTPPKRWHLAPHDPHTAARLAPVIRTSPVIAQLLLNRGITDADTARSFLDAPLNGLHAPQLLPGVPEAAERVVAAVRAGRKICIYGDYDADGVTGTAVLFRLLRLLGTEPAFYVPHRLNEGYGLNAEAVRQLAADGVSLVVTVDCGIASLEEVGVAKECGLEVIVTDHHEMKDRLPEADVLVHPRLPGSAYPFPGLSGSGVAFKLAWAVAQLASGSDRVTPTFRDYLLDALGLAALGLIADVVPLRDENRVFVRHGLARIAANPGHGMKALIESSGLAEKVIRAEDVAFKLAPRLNAAGRLGCARLVVELLTTQHPHRAKEIAAYLEQTNGERQALERKYTQEACEMVEAGGGAEGPAIVLASPHWHAGVIGIIAGRLASRFARPVLLIAMKDGEGVYIGSGRSVAGFPLHEALAACGSELLSHGGHAAAAGFKVLPSQIEAFRERFLAVAAKWFPDGPPAPALELDAEVPLSALTFGLVADLDKLEPYGQDNPRPRFLAADLTVQGSPRRMGAGERHLSFRVRQGETTVRAVGWGMGERLDQLMSAGGRCCLAFSPRINEWNGQRSVEMELIDFRAGADPILS